MLKTITSQIEKAWEDTGSEFASTRNPKAVFWTEQASLKYPFYFNLRRQLKKSGIDQRIAAIPEYRPSIPLNAMCGDRLCPCKNARRHNEQIHIDLCLVEFEEKIHRSNIEYREDKYRTMWCYKPHPIVAMEFKYPYIYDEWKFDEDIKKLLTMKKVYGTELLYLCFATYEYVDTKRLLTHIKKRIEPKSSAKGEFRLAVGTLKKKDWKICHIK